MFIFSPLTKKDRKISGQKRFLAGALSVGITATAGLTIEHCQEFFLRGHGRNYFPNIHSISGVLLFSTQTEKRRK